jgi:hypothetical protein
MWSSSRRLPGVIVMRIWSIQPDEVWKTVRGKGVAYVDQDDGKCRGYIPPAYRWLQARFACRIPGYSGHLLWWGYCRKPDLRCHRHLLQKGTWVRLELEMPEALLLRFPCWAWHQVFCQDYLALTKQEYEDWTGAMRSEIPDEEIWPPPEPWKSELEASWERLFAAELPNLSWNPDSVWSRTVCYEAVFEPLRYADVQAVTPCTGSLVLRCK